MLETVQTILMEERRLQIFTLLTVLAGSGVFLASGMTVYTPEEVEAVNGTDVKLMCTFQSTAAILPSLATVAWNFQPQDGGSEESVFYFQEKAYPALHGRFKGQVVWVGDIASGDASILLHNVKFTFNGTFSCRVKNPPDVHGKAGELLLRVVHTASFSEITILATAVGGAIGLVLLILAIFVSFKYCRQRSLERELEMSQWKRKDSTVCDPEETLNFTEGEGEVVNYSDEASAREVSSKDEKKSLEMMSEDTTNSDIVPAKDDIFIINVTDNIIPTTNDGDATLAMNDKDVVPKEETNHPSAKKQETTEKRKPGEEVPTEK